MVARRILDGIVKNVYANNVSKLAVCGVTLRKRAEEEGSTNTLGIGSEPGAVATGFLSSAVVDNTEVDVPSTKLWKKR